MQHQPESKFVKMDQQEILPCQTNFIKTLQGLSCSERPFKKIAVFSQTLREVSQRSSHSDGRNKVFLPPPPREGEQCGGNQGWGEAVPRAREQDGLKDRSDSSLSWVPGSPPVSFLQIGFIECNILIKNTHTFPFWCIKRFLTKHCNVAINFSPGTLKSYNSALAFRI